MSLQSNIWPDDKSSGYFYEGVSRKAYSLLGRGVVKVQRRNSDWAIKQAHGLARPRSAFSTVPFRATLVPDEV
jgi:hypothetical protein